VEFDGDDGKHDFFYDGKAASAGGHGPSADAVCRAYVDVAALPALPTADVVGLQTAGAVGRRAAVQTDRRPRPM
ncbi:hypothetical protein ACC687_40260, partial [Rhizobium ruizarguesonis]